MERMERTQRTAPADALAAPQRSEAGGRGWEQDPASPAWPLTDGNDRGRDAPGWAAANGNARGRSASAFDGGAYDTEACDLPINAARPAASGAVEALRSEVSDLRARLAQAAPKRAVVEMDRAITLLHHRVEDMREAGLGSSRDEMAYLAEELLELRTALDEVRAPERFQALSAGVEMLARKIDILNARAVDPVEVARLQSQSAELKSLVVRAVSGAGLQPLAERLAACAEEITRSSSETAQRVAEATSVFERNAEALISRVTAYEASVREEHSASSEELRRQVETHVEAGMHGIHDRLDRVSEYVAALPPAVASELAGHLAPLLDRLDIPRSSEAAGSAAPLAEVVEHHLIALTDRFQDAHARLERLDGIEALLADLKEEMRRAHSATTDAAQEAVEVAVEAVSRKVSTDPDGPAVVGLKRGLAALEARQEQVERRASEILGENLARGLEDRTVVLDRTADDVWAHQPQVDDVPLPDSEFDPAEPLMEGPDHAAMEEAAPEPYIAEPYPAEPGAPELGPGAPMAEEAEPAYAMEPEQPAPAEPEAPRDFFSDSRLAPQMRGPALDLDDVRPDPVVPRVKKVRRGRSTADVHIPTRSGAQGPRPRVDRNRLNAKRPIATRISPAVIAVAALAVLATASAGTAWTHRDAIKAGFTQAMGEMGNPLTVVAQKLNAAQEQTRGQLKEQATKSTADLPAPTGPQPLRTAALDGNLAAAYEVGVRFADGVGIPQDLDAGIKWLGYAVSRGYAPAGYRLGSLYENSLHNMDEAYRFYKWSAEQGNVRAMHNLAVLYSQGIDGKPDWGEALKWFRKAAELGLKDSQHNLGIIFARGFSGTSDLGEALTWFNIAARQGDQDSAEKRDALAREADQMTLARARKAADAFVAKPMNEAANVVAVLPEWNASEAGEHVAANSLASNDVVFSANLVTSKR